MTTVTFADLGIAEPLCRALADQNYINRRAAQSAHTRTIGCDMRLLPSNVKDLAAEDIAWNGLSRGSHAGIILTKATKKRQIR